MNIRTLPARRALVGLSLVAAGLVAGGAVAAVGSAYAADTSTPTATSTATPGDDGGGSGETELTGDNLASVKEAVLKEYPGATFTRVETDSDGVYEAHIVTADGSEVTVELDDSFAVTGTEAHGGGGRGHGGGSGETALTGDNLASVKEAVLKEYPGATFTRVETDNGGVYEAHIVTADGDEITVALGDDFSITGTD